MELRGDTESLVRAARAGDEEAFAELVRAERASLVMAARIVTGDRHEAEDAAQEALVTAYRRLETLSDPARFRPWLSTILTRVAIRRGKKLRRLSPSPDLDSRPGPTSDRDARLDALLDEVVRLPDKYRLLLSLFYLRGHTCREVAELTELTEQRVKSRLHRARELLRAKLEEVRDDDI